MIYGYIRVSSDRQTTANQKYEIAVFCERENISIDKWVEETISGTRDYGQRKLGALLRKVKAGDMIVCTELSRLGRSFFMIMDILNLCMEKDCRVRTIKEGYRLGEDIQSKVLAFAFGISAEIERQLISERTREALARKKAEGKRLGRRPGSRNRAYKLDSRAALINRMLREGKSRRTIARHCKVAKSTLDRWLKLSATDNCPAANMPDYQPITETPPPSRPPGKFA